MKSPRDIVTQLFVSTDQHQWNSVIDCFHSEVLMDYSSMNGNPATSQSPDEIVKAWKDILPGFEHTHHQLGNFLENFEGNSAEVFCYGTASHYLNDEKGSLWLVVGSYDLELLKNEKGSWKIKSMKFNFKYQDGNLSLPEKAINKLK